MLQKMICLLIIVSVSSCVASPSSESGDRVEEILRLSLRATSSHNAQPWKIVQVKSGVYDLYSVKERWLYRVDPDNRELGLSLGILIESIHQSAEAYGYICNFELRASSVDDIYIGRFKFKTLTGIKNEKSLNILKSIYNDKGKYEKNNLPKYDITRIKTSFPNNLTYIGLKDIRFKWLKKNTVLANDQQAYRDDIQRELASYFCFSSKDKERGIGITPEMIALPGIMIPFWYLFITEESIMKRSFRDGTAPKVKSQIENSAGFFILTNRGYGLEDLINCGREYQKLLVLCRELNIEVHPISQLLEESPWGGVINNSLDIKNPIQFILRVGKVKKNKRNYDIDAISSASIRMPYENVVGEK